MTRLCCSGCQRWMLTEACCRHKASQPPYTQQSEETGSIDQEIQSYNTPGFSGCLSRVQFNLIAPLKLALRSRNNSQVQVVGELVESNCGASPLTIPQMATDNNPWHQNSE
ncbi:hypothetical protein GDO81_028803, partial [Engystomops pustulosus]